MKISEKKVGIIHYTLKNNDGVVLDSSQEQPPLSYVHGMKNLIPGMEKALEGKAVGDKLKIVIPPEEAYGVKRENLINEVPIKNFPEKENVKVGMQFETVTPEGPKVAMVLKVANDTVTVDFNHPLAGETLNFDIEVVEVRDATDEELSHGHVHGEGCNH